MPFVIPVVVCLLLPIFNSARISTTVQSIDGSIGVSFSNASGISEISLSNSSISLFGHAGIIGGIPFTNLIENSTDGIRVSSGLCIHQANGICGAQQALVNLSFSPRPDSVRIELTVEGHPRNTFSKPWTSPVFVKFTFRNANKLQLWAPWNRNTSIDPLRPSDGGYSWWTDQYNLGLAHVTGEPQDYVIAEHVSVLDPGASSGFSLIADPRDDPTPQGWLNLTGDGGADCLNSSTCSASASFAISHHMLRIEPGLVHRRAFDLVSHHAACWRPGLSWSVRQYPAFWKPTFPEARRTDGLGSYSSYLGDLTEPKWRQMSYQTNWDLGGRFFPYMGMFLPPLHSRDEMWLNDVEGSQDRANCSFASIDGYYRNVQARGFTSLSYFNVFEFGANVTYGPWRAAPDTLQETNWQNSSQYLDDNFRPALLTNYACQVGDGGKCNSKSWRPVSGLAQHSWQNSVLMDPRLGLGYDVSLLSQIRRKMKQLIHFQGIAVDRSDWSQVVNLDGDDGYTLVGDRPGWSLKRSYLQILQAVRNILDSSVESPKVMLNNLAGYAWLPFMQHFDGSFSEHEDVNAVGLLGLASTTILWVGPEDEVVSDPDVFFQKRLHMGVFPMAPFPKNDHAILPSADADTRYIRYGGLFNAMKNASWSLDAHPIEVNPSHVKSNAFWIGDVLLYTLMLAGNKTHVVTATLRNVIAPASNLQFEVLHPGRGNQWIPIAVEAIERNVVWVQVPLSSGCALLRVSPIEESITIV